MGNRAVGKNSTVSIKKEDGSYDTYCVTDINLDAVCELLEASDTCSDGHQEFEPGFDGATGSITCNYDPTKSFVPKCKPGNEITVKITVTGGGQTKTVTIPGYAGQLSLGSPVKGLVTFTLNFTASGWDQTDWNSL